jgi:hypothetical protein
VFLYSSSQFPLWLRVFLAVVGVVIFVVLAWGYYVRYWRRR